MKRTSTFTSTLQSMSDKTPIDNMPPVINVFGTSIAGIDVISMLPDINNKDRTTSTLKDRVAVIVAVDDLELALSVEDEPDPSRSEMGSCTLAELFLELVNTAKVLSETLGELLRNLVGFFVLDGCQTGPVEVVVKELAHIGTDGTLGLGLHDSAFTHSGILGLGGNELSQLGSISMGVLAVVVLDGLGADVGGKSVFGEFERTRSEGCHC